MAVVEYGKAPIDVAKGIFDYWGTGAPSTPLANAVAGSLYRQLDGGAGSMTWQKTTSGWEALAPAGGAPTWTSITGKPTTIVGFGITDAVFAGGVPLSGVSTITATGVVTGSGFSGAGGSLTGLNATQLTSGTVPVGRLYTTIAGYGITDFNSLGDARWLLLTGGTLSGALTITTAGNSLLQTVAANTSSYHTVSINAAAYVSLFGADSSGVGFVGSFTNIPFTIRVNNAEVARFNSGAPFFSISGANPTYQGFLMTASTGTNGVGATFTNTGGRFFVGSDNSAGTGVGAGTYNSYIWTESARDLVFGTNNVERARIDSAGSFLIKAAVGAFGITSTTGINHAYIDFINTGGTYYLGVDNNTGSTFTSGTAYSMVAYTPAGLAWWINKSSNVQTFTQVPLVTVSGVTTRQIAMVIMSGAAPTTDTAPDGTIWLQF